MTAIRAERVPPTKGEAGKLTVVLWIAEDPRVISDDFLKATRSSPDGRETSPLSRAGARRSASRSNSSRPRRAEMEANLWEAATRLEPLSPAFVSVTYGAGGSTRERTHAMVERIARETTMKPAAHLTCVGASKDEIRETLRAYHVAGVRHVVALRGDPPTGFDAPYETAPDGYRSTAELVADDQAWAISRSRSRPIRSAIRKARRCCTISRF